MLPWPWFHRADEHLRYRHHDLLHDDHAEQLASVFGFEHSTRQVRYSVAD
jgi:hypothetical protein